MSGRRDDDSSSDEVLGAQGKELFDPKSTSKVVRVLTVLAYLLSVSFAAILLSVYYIFVWKAPSGAGVLAQHAHENPYSENATEFSGASMSTDDISVDLSSTYFVDSSSTPEIFDSSNDSMYEESLTPERIPSKPSILVKAHENNAYEDPTKSGKPVAAKNFYLRKKRRREDPE